MQTPDDVRISLMAPVHEAVKERIRNVIEPRILAIHTVLTTVDVRRPILRDIKSDLKRMGFEVQIIEAEWHAEFISSIAQSQGVRTDRRYEVIRIVQRSPASVTTFDPFAYMYLNCQSSYDLCFVDFYQVRKIAVSSKTAIMGFSPIPSSKSTVMALLLREESFHDAVRAAYSSKDIRTRMQNNVREDRPVMANSCTDFTVAMREFWKNAPARNMFSLSIVSGRWNSLCASRDYIRSSRQTTHDWIRFRYLPSCEVIDFDFTWGQFIDTVPSLGDLGVHFFDVGQMRSIGTNDQDRMEIASSGYAA